MPPITTLSPHYHHTTGRKPLFIMHQRKQARRKALHLLACIIIMHKIFILHKALWPSITRKPLFYMAIN